MQVGVYCWPQAQNFLKISNFVQRGSLACCLAWHQICNPLVLHPGMVGLQMWKATCGASLLPLVPEVDKLSIIICSVTEEILGSPAQPPKDRMLPSYFKFKTNNQKAYICVLCHQFWHYLKRRQVIFIQIRMIR